MFTGSIDIYTLVLVEEDVVDPEMVSVEAMVGGGRVVGEAFLEVGEKDPCLHASGGILQALQHRPEGTVGGVAGLLAVLQELVHSGPHYSVSRTPPAALANSQSTERRKGRTCLFSRGFFFSILYYYYYYSQFTHPVACDSLCLQREWRSPSLTLFMCFSSTLFYN
jgi:hypothetical protein